jgi:hypothetical protein
MLDRPLILVCNTIKQQPAIRHDIVVAHVQQKRERERGEARLYME